MGAKEALWGVLYLMVLKRKGIICIKCCAWASGLADFQVKCIIFYLGWIENNTGFD